LNLPDGRGASKDCSSPPGPSAATVPQRPRSGLVWIRLGGRVGACFESLLQVQPGTFGLGEPPVEVGSGGEGLEELGLVAFDVRLRRSQPGLERTLLRGQ